MVSSNPRVLITGAAGFLGSRLAMRMAAMGWKVVGIDIVPRSGATRLTGVDIEYRWQSLQDISELDVEYVVHAAAVADVPFALSSPRYAFQQNAMGTLGLLEAAKGVKGLKRIIIQSSESVYGHAARIPITEDSPLNPSNVYGASKAAEELLGIAYHHSHGLPVTIIRSSTLYGEGMRLNQVIPIFLTQALKGQPITIHGRGDQSRDFNYVGNLVNGILLALQHPQAAGGTFNIAGDVEVSVRGLAERCIEITGSSSAITSLPQRPGEEGVRLVPDISRARELLAYEPKVSFEEGLERTAQWVAEGLQIPWPKAAADVVGETTEVEK